MDTVAKEKIEIIETKQYLGKLATLLHKGQREDVLREEIKELIRKDPLSGDVIPGTGGLRKIRYAMGGKGKKGGCRIIYYFYDERHPLNLFTIYLKSEKKDISPQEKQAFSKLVVVLKKIYKNL